MEKTIKPAVAIIGYGNIARVVADNLVRNGRPVIIAGRDFSKAKALTDQMGNLARPMEITAAIHEADIIVLAIWFHSIKSLLYQYEEVLQGKIIIDPSNPIVPDGMGGFKKAIGQNESAGQLNAALLPKNANFVKALGTLSASSLAAASNRRPDPAVLFYASDDSGIKTEIEDLIHDMGFAPVNIGGIDQSIRIEVFGDLHEFGALGKVVSVPEAKEKCSSHFVS